jgi:hypothetical protein
VIVGVYQLQAQIVSSSSKVEAWPETDRTVYYNVMDTGEHMPMEWGLDLAWLSEVNIRRGMAFMNSENVDVIRSSFTPTAALVNGELPAHELSRLQERLSAIALLGRKMNVVLNCDHPSVDEWYVGNPENWAQLIDVTTRLHQEAGHTVVAVSPFNEPDYSQTGQGTIDDFYNIAGELRKNSLFDSIRISGGNTLNCDQALPWYNQLKGRLDEGNTHQLAGSFDNYASFYEAVRANGHHASNDELHNVMEAMVGLEYGLQTGIWWGTAEYTRGEFVKASDGTRLGYAEHRPNWTAASVYRHTNGKVQGFVGSSERQATTTTYRFVSKDKDVYYDGQGPQREFILEIPGGTGYQEGQSNAEGLVNITWGDDIQPVIGGQYRIVNQNSTRVMEVSGGATNAGANVVQGSAKTVNYQYWNVTPVDAKVGGDFSYFSIINARSAKSLDILNWSLDDGGNIIVWDDSKGTNQQWYLEYAADGWFYIRSRYSAKCLEIASSSTAIGANIQQGEKDGAANQLWRFMPVSASVEFEKPSAPTELLASINASSIRLEWMENSESDLASYTIFRSETEDGIYNTIARNITTTAFIDNTVLADVHYFYKVKAIDESLNSSSFSTVVSMVDSMGDDMITHLSFEDHTLDSSLNAFHATSLGGVSYTEGKVGSKAIILNGSDAFVQLSPNVVKQRTISISTWIYWNGGASWQRIFDFGNDQNQYMYLTPKLRFAIKDGGAEQRLESASLPKKEWVHLAVAIGDSAIQIYVNGERVAESSDIAINPFDFKPGINYIGRSQYSVPLFNGYIDDFKVYNYVLTAEDVAREYSGGDVSQMIDVQHAKNNLRIWPIPASEKVYIDLSKNKD